MMSNGSGVVVLSVDGDNERGEEMVSTHGLGGDGGRRGGMESQRGIALVLGGTSFR